MQQNWTKFYFVALYYGTAHSNKRKWVFALHLCRWGESLQCNFLVAERCNICKIVRSGAFVVAMHYIFLKQRVAIFANEYTEYRVVNFAIKHSTVYIAREIWFTHLRNTRNRKVLLQNCNICWWVQGGAFCYRPQEIAGCVCPRACVTLDSPQLYYMYLCICEFCICVFVFLYLYMCINHRRLQVVYVHVRASPLPCYEASPSLWMSTYFNLFCICAHCTLYLCIFYFAGSHTVQQILKFPSAHLGYS